MPSKYNKNVNVWQKCTDNCAGDNSDKVTNYPRHDTLLPRTAQFHVLLRREENSSAVIREVTSSGFGRQNELLSVNACVMAATVVLESL